ncbi:8976_t:CDS:2 [Entrophospora sp. SA101]|nr:8976_t:CDS:2 [Entrophospora sp. SA101]
MVIDAWNQIAHPDFIKGVPEVSRLLLQSKMPLACKICLSAWYRPGKAVITNDMISEWTQKYSDRFIGISDSNKSESPYRKDFINPIVANVLWILILLE